jgi:hypothetical protein
MKENNQDDLRDWFQKAYLICMYPFFIIMLLVFGFWTAFYSLIGYSIMSYGFIESGVKFFGWLERKLK